MEAAAIGTGSNVSNTSSSGSSYSCSRTFFMSLNETFGAASRSSASLAWNCSRYSSGTRPTSRNERTWPSFMAAPFIVPSAATTCSAVSYWRRASASRRASSPRNVLAARVPACRAACPAASRPTREDRASREVGILSSEATLSGYLRLHHGTHPHLLPHRRHRPLRRVLRGTGLRGAPAHADPRRGDQRLHGPPRRRR